MSAGNQRWRPACLRVGALVLWVWALLPAEAARRWTPYELVDSADLHLTGLSPLGRTVLRDPGAWMIGRSEHFLVFAKSRPAVQNAIDDAENALNEAENWLGAVPAETNQILLVFVDDPDRWDRLIERYELRPDGIAMQLGREIFFKDLPGMDIKPERVQHEVIQLAMIRTLGDATPLWLQEGMASFFGWKLAVKMNNQRGLLISRQRPVMDPAQLFDPAELLRIERYPASEERARVFYRQSEELAGILYERLGPEGFRRFLADGFRGGDEGPAAFLEAAGLADQDWDAIVRELERRCAGAE